MIEVVPGMHVLAIPTPFDIGPVNVVVVEGDPLTLVDTGPRTDEALAVLEQGLAAHGHRVEDVGLVLLTHGHLDHMGLAATIARRSGAEVAALDLVAPYLASLDEEGERVEAYTRWLLGRHGAPESVVASRPETARAFATLGEPVHVDRPLQAGGVLALGDRRLRILHRPGHSPYDTIFHDERDGTLIAGDHLIAHVSSNPISTGWRGEDGAWRRTRPLMDYLTSLAATRELDVGTVLTGHGAPISDHRALIDDRVGHHRTRLERIREIIRSEPSTAYHVASEIWSEVRGAQAFLMLSEVLGHIDLLVAAGEVQERESGGVVVYAPA